jgi:hypothetical protein
MNTRPCWGGRKKYEVKWQGLGMLSKELCTATRSSFVVVLLFVFVIQEEGWN